MYKYKTIVMLIFMTFTLSFFSCFVESAVATQFPQSVRELDYNPMKKVVAGQRYEALVPDTLDLADRMGLAITPYSHTAIRAYRPWWKCGWKVPNS